MTLQVARGLFRLWLVLSVLWIGGVGVVTWPAFDPAKLAATKDAPYTGYFDPDAFLAARSSDAGRRQKRPFYRSHRQPSRWPSDRRWCGCSGAFGDIPRMMVRRWYRQRTSHPAESREHP
jgi:hypothetical protein